MFFTQKSLKSGELLHIAVPKGKHQFTGIEQQDSVYKISSAHNVDFFAKLKHNKGQYQFISLADIKDAPSKDSLFIEGIGATGLSLRKAQKGAVYGLLPHWSFSRDPAMVVLPTGTGKTETMFVSALADKAERTLIIVPTIDLKLQTAEKFATFGKLRELGVITHGKPNPIIAVLSKTLTEVNELNDAQVVVSTPGLLARAALEVQNKLKSIFSHVFFDEAHHIEASEWKYLKNLFGKAKIVQFTATPYRNDKAPVEGVVVYNYTLKQALADEVFSKISLISVDQRYPKLKDQAIADAAMARLAEDRKNGLKRHKVMVRTEKQKHAEELYLNYKEWYPSERIALVHSGTKNKKKVIDQIKNGDYDIVICVDMLKEGFDFPDFKIAAVHKLHKSLGVLLQFIGRFARTQPGLGEAAFIVNFADENLTIDLENLLQEGSGWEFVISQIADAKKADAESLLTFLQGCKPFSGFDSANLELNPKLVYPALSCVCFSCEKVEWKHFKDAFNINRYALTQPYYNQSENVFYFSTQKREKVKWAKTDKLRDQTWDLIVMHHDPESQLLYIGYTEKLLDVEKLVELVSGKKPIMLNGDCVFRAFDAIKRLSIVHAGIFKPANHLHRYSRLSGADVTTELSRWKEGKRCQKSDFVGIGFRDGFPVSVGASVKGKVWSPARIGDLKQWKTWCLNVGKLITDETIDSNQLLENSAEKKQLDVYPEDIVLATDWSEELYVRIHKLMLTVDSKTSVMLSECVLKNVAVNKEHADFVLTVLDKEIPFSIHLGGERGHSITGLDDSKIMIEGLKADPVFLKRFFEENPPTMFLLNGCTISGSIHTNYNVSQNVKIPKDRIHILPWDQVNYQTESMYMKGQVRENSVQEYMMKKLVDAGATIVFNDDNSGESADIVAIFHEDYLIRFELIHCKYSKQKAGSRLNDLFEVCGQAIVSLRYKWKPEELLKHMERRDGTGVLKGKRFYYGQKQDLERIRKAIRYTNTTFEFAIAQPGVKSSRLTDEMMDFLGSIYGTVVEMTETKLKCYFNN
ncbi:DEAD/DEAH box helicase [Pedobacter sp. MC2016-24]|uniref:DEAD/DEAH box helicase n=1 Tax=Pedobacter sp. MC2016-24 TaxID=2780090 RepID=UPI001D167D16|nr:DEAD/DEAH box helicase family protein [Pedobacter sp. MC2016-24]